MREMPKKPKNEAIAVIVYKAVMIIKGITRLDKEVMSKIISLDNEDNGHCTASNGFIAEEIDSIPESVSRSIRKLEKLGHLDISILRGQRVIKCSLTTGIRALQADYKKAMKTYQIEMRAYQIDKWTNQNDNLPLSES